MRAPVSLFVACLLAVGLTACANSETERMAQLEAELQRKTGELQDARERYDQQFTEFTASVRERHAREIEALETRLAEEEAAFTRTIRSLQAQLDGAKPAGEAPASVTPAPPTPAPPPLPPRIVTRAAAPTATSFPVIVTNVTGEQAVIGSHASTRLVETEELYRDSFGNMKKRKVPETYEIPEYGYRATAALRNPSDAPATVTLRCGQGEETLTLAPGEQRAVAVDSTPGAPLVVRVDGRTASYEVSYP